MNSFNLEPTFAKFPSLRKYLVNKTCPTSTAEFARSNTPMIHVHVSLFDDLTVIGVTSSDMMFDAFGLGTLLHAWTHILAGDEIETIPGMEWNLAPFESFKIPGPMTCVRGYGYLIPEKYPLFLMQPVVKLVYDWMEARMRDREVCRLIRVPKAFLDERRREIMESLKLQGSSEWVAPTDVLLAWWFKTSYSCHRPDDREPISIHLSVDLRTKHVFPGASGLNTPYINNAASTICLVVCAGTLRTESLGDLSLRIRRAITEYDGDLVTLQQELRWREANQRITLLRCPPGYKSELQTNWCETQLSALDSLERVQGGKTRRRAVWCVWYASTL
ncbi:hypothetical protein B0H19DRAFT_1142617 [Mycena capillaripes]|nr:hypothetical protein B0H19DRAFT_1142617 [Mycena capillaripes]